MEVKIMIDLRYILNVEPGNKSSQFVYSMYILRICVGFCLYLYAYKIDIVDIWIMHLWAIIQMNANEWILFGQNEKIIQIWKKTFLILWVPIAIFQSIYTYREVHWGSTEEQINPLMSFSQSSASFEPICAFWKPLVLAWKGGKAFDQMFTYCRGSIWSSTIL